MTCRNVLRFWSHLAAAVALMLLTGMGLTPAVAQTTDPAPAQTQTETPAAPAETADPVSPAAERSGWLDIGTWGIVVLVVIAALVVWFAFFRPRARPDQRRKP